MKPSWIVLVFLLISVFHGPTPTCAVTLPETPTYRWQEGPGLDSGAFVRGPVLWQNQPCSSIDPLRKVRLEKFPRFLYRFQLKGEAIKEHEGYYCWNIEVPRHHIGHLLHLNLIRVFGISTLSINGHPIWSQDDSKEAPKSLELFYPLQSSILSFEMSLRCGTSEMCGFRGTFKARTEVEGAQITLRSRILDFFAFSGLVFCFLFHQVISVLRRRYNAALMISLMALALGTRIILSGQGQLHTFIKIPEYYFLRLEIIAAYILIPSTISISRETFPLDAPRLIERLAWGFAIPSGCALAFAPSEWILPFLLVMYVLILLALIDFTVIIFRGFRNQRTAIWTFTLSAFIIVTSTFFEVLNTRVNIELIAGSHPLGYFASSLIASVLFAARISEAFSRVEAQEQSIATMSTRLNEDIALFDQRIEERTRSLRLLIETLPTGIVLINQNEQGAWEVHGSYSRFLREKLEVQVNDWDSFHNFSSRLIPQFGLEHPSQLQQIFAALMSEPADFQRMITMFFPNHTIWTGSPHPRYLKLKWAPILEDNRMAGVYLFLMDITEIVTLEEAAKKAEWELHALEEILNLQLDRATQLEIQLRERNILGLRDIGDRWGLSTLQKLLTLSNHQEREQALTVYQATLSLLQRFLPDHKEDQRFDLLRFLHHPLWQNLPSEERLAVDQLAASLSLARASS